jgi:hypothetical protein
VVVEWCYMCKKSGESIDHLLLRCNVAHDMWSIFNSLFGVEWLMPRRVLDLLNSWGNLLGRGQVKQIWKQVPSCVMWGLWRENNARHFEDVEMPLLELRRNMLNTLFIWVLAHHSPSRVTFAEFSISCFSVSFFLEALWYTSCVY